MRKPPTNKDASRGVASDRPAHTPATVERFPRRVGVRVESDRQLTPAEIQARQEEQDLVAKAQEFRARKRLVNRTDLKTEPIVVEGLDPRVSQP